MDLDERVALQVKKEIRKDIRNKRGFRNKGAASEAKNLLLGIKEWIEKIKQPKKLE